MHVLKYSSLPTVDMDLTLIDVACGYFASFSYASSSAISLPFVRDFARLASLTVSRARAKEYEAHEGPSSTSYGGDMLNTNSCSGGYNAYQPNTGDVDRGSASGLPSSRDDLTGRPHTSSPRTNALGGQAESSEWLDEDFNWDSLLAFPNDTFLDI